MTTQEDADAAFDRLTAGRWSCRAFRADPVPSAVLRRIAELAGRAPSWCNAQPWRVDIASGAACETLRRCLSMHASADPVPDLAWPERYEGVYASRRRACGFQLYEAAGIARDDRAGRALQSDRNFAFFDAPHVAFVSVERALGPYAVLDGGSFITQFMLAATSLGVASIAQASVAAHAERIRAVLDIGEDRTILCGISLGYPIEGDPVNRFRTSRADIDEVARFHDNAPQTARQKLSGQIC